MLACLSVETARFIRRAPGSALRWKTGDDDRSSDEAGADGGKSEEPAHGDPPALSPQRHHSGVAARCVSSSDYRVSQRPNSRILTNAFLAREISQNSGGLTFAREISVLQGNATSRKHGRGWEQRASPTGLEPVRPET